MALLVNEDIYDLMRSAETNKGGQRNDNYFNKKMEGQTLQTLARLGETDKIAFIVDFFVSRLHTSTIFY